MGKQRAAHSIITQNQGAYNSCMDADDFTEQHMRLAFVLRTASDEDLLRSLEEFEEEMGFDNLSLEALVAHSWVVEEGLRRYSREVRIWNMLEWQRIGGYDLSVIEYLSDEELDGLPSIADSLKKVLNIAIK